MNLHDAYKILELENGADKDAINNAFRKLVSLQLTLTLKSKLKRP